MRLPSQWNGKFFFEGGGGSNGNAGEALGNLQGQQTTNALVLGYAVVSQDSGHDNATNNDPKLNGSQTFGFDEQARLDFGYNSYDQVTQAAKALIKLYYGKGPERSYYLGCSEGGREAMMMSQRFPDYLRRHPRLLARIQASQSRRRRSVGRAGVRRGRKGRGRERSERRAVSQQDIQRRGPRARRQRHSRRVRQARWTRRRHGVQLPSLHQRREHRSCRQFCL
jgi:hypothetical protein